MKCNHCEFGFLNIDQVPADVLGTQAVLQWIKNNTGHDVKICDCCGDGEDWYGKPGEHYDDTDPPGPNGPYAYNGGLAECH